MAAGGGDGDAARVFLRLLTRSQTRELGQWNAESLRRALLWAKAAERVARGGGRCEQLGAELELATLPSTGRKALASDLERATQYLLLAVLTSPFLATHPIRSELVGIAMKEVREQRRTDPESPLIAQSAIASAIARRVVDAKRGGAAAAIARAVSRGFKPVRVSVLTGAVTIPPLESYLTKPRTIHLYEVALTLQLNAASAMVPSDRSEYNNLLLAVRMQLAEDTSNDVLEMLALLLTRCPWPMREMSGGLSFPDSSADFEDILLSWAADKPSRLLSLPPWPATLLAAKSPKAAAIYLPYLLQRGFMDPGIEFAHRVGGLALQSSALSSAVSSSLAQLDPLVRSKLLKIGASRGFA